MEANVDSLCLLEGVLTRGFCIDTLVSGSPIIQDGKLVGAVTHVLVEDPTRGYGIFAETMLQVAEETAKEAKPAA